MHMCNVHEDDGMISTKRWNLDYEDCSQEGNMCKSSSVCMLKVEDDMGSEKRRHSDPGECSHLGLGVKFMGGRPRPGFYNSPPILPSFMVN